MRPCLFTYMPMNKTKLSPYWDSATSSSGTTDSGSDLSPGFRIGIYCRIPSRWWTGGRRAWVSWISSPAPGISSSSMRSGSTIRRAHYTDSRKKRCRSICHAPTSAHEVEFLDVLAMADLLDQCPPVTFITVVPEKYDTMEVRISDLLVERFSDIERLLLEELAALSVKPVRRPECTN